MWTYITMILFFTTIEFDKDVVAIDTTFSGIGKVSYLNYRYGMVDLIRLLLVLKDK